MSLSEAIRTHLADSYPHNHDYRVAGEELKPRWKLMRRWRRMEPLWPESFGSFLDVGCSKGFFVLQAARRGAEALGIDIHEGDLLACDAVRDHLGLSAAKFERKTLILIVCAPVVLAIVLVVALLPDVGFQVGG